MSKFAAQTATVHLGRFDLGNVGSLSPSALLTLPSASQNKRQKFCIGDPQGTLTCYVVGKKLAIEEVWKLPLSKTPISSLSLGGLKSLKDQVFAAGGTTIWGVKKTGKSFFQFDTSLAEPITFLDVNHLRLHVKTAHTYTVFEQNKDLTFATVGDTINAVVMTNITSDIDHDAILGCQDKYIRVVSGDRILVEAKVHGAVTALALFTPPPAVTEAHPANSVHLLYGTSLGVVGHVVIDRTELTIKHGMTFTSPTSTVSATVSASSSTSSSSSTSTSTSLLSSSSTSLSSSLLDATALQSSAPVSALAWAAVATPITSSSSSTSSSSNAHDFMGIVVARSDGAVQVTLIDQQGVPEPIPSFATSVGERIVNMNTGLYLSTTRQELLISTFSGKLIVLSPEIDSSVANAKLVPLTSVQQAAAAAQAGGNANALAAAVGADNRSIVELQNEIEGLKRQVQLAKEQYARSTLAGLVAHQTPLAIIHSLTFDSTASCHRLVIELETSIEVVGVYCNRHMTVIPSTAERAPIVCLNSKEDSALFAASSSSSSSSTPSSTSASTPSILSPTAETSPHGSSSSSSNQSNLLVSTSTSKFSAAAAALLQDRDALNPDHKDGFSHEGSFVASFRCVPNSHRIELSFRLEEGQAGKLTCHIIPAMEPKRSQTVSFDIKPLCLHEHVDRAVVASRIDRQGVHLGSVSLLGDFKLTQIHGWLSALLPEVPSYPLSDTSGQLYYTSSLTGAMLAITYASGKAVFLSDALSTLALVKDFLSRQAAAERVRANTVVDISAAAAMESLAIIEPLLNAQFATALDLALLKPLTDLQNNEEELDSFLDDKYLAILRDAESLEAAQRNTPKTREAVIATTLATYRACFSLRGQWPANERDVAALLSPTTYNLEALRGYFQAAFH